MTFARLRVRRQLVFDREPQTPEFKNPCAVLRDLQIENLWEWHPPAICVEQQPQDAAALVVPITCGGNLRGAITYGLCFEGVPGMCFHARHLFGASSFFGIGNQPIFRSLPVPVLPRPGVSLYSLRRRV